ncbi:hypothetical protein SLEP1_g35023 [Rubroshorea leprosula]|uniref:Uncharacterized protein n=1 Tax=Rubroshorea leprosula TaxID=152421 RepID=A0AAV5KLX5_9ROSI|nr:hypothetical protein SLEP1_g35023 [Rubroshorea leprosula]
MGSDGCRCGKPSDGPDLDPVMEAPDQFVEDYISNLSTIPMDLSKLLCGEVHVLNVGTRDAEATDVFRIHQFLGDGMSLMSLLLACCRKSYDSYILLFQWCIVVTLVSLDGVEVNLVTMVDLWLFTVTLFFLKDTDTPLKGAAGVGQNPKQFGN